MERLQSDTTIETTLPNHDLTPFLVTPTASCTLMSIGADTEGTRNSHVFFNNHCFKLKGLQVYKERSGNLSTRFVGSPSGRVRYIGTKSKSGGVYTTPPMNVFKPNEYGD